ncbi:MAG: hypothetical protein Q9190_004229 [Brigantiaea leucoxantha]
MNDLEEQRQQNIKRNQERLKELGVYRSSFSTASAPTRTGSKPKIVRKVKPASRSSARIASAISKPTYNEDANSASERIRRTSRKASKERVENIKDEEPVQRGISGLDVEDVVASWTKWSVVAAPPFRDEDSTFHFETHPSFTPNKSPEEMLREGCFGGSYFRPLFSKHLGLTIADDYKELPSSWIDGLDISNRLVRPEYDPEVNKFKVPCGQSIEEWEAAGWINHTYDVRGWFQWYCRFFMGRRCEDDERQVDRWKRCVGEKGRWRRILLTKYVALGIREVFDDGEDDREGDVSLKVSQTCLHWAFEVRQNILDAFWEKSR